MKNSIPAFCVSLLFLIFPSVGSAHPGHGEHGGYTIIHYLVEPIHIILSVGILVVIVAFYRNLKKKRQPKENTDHA